ncbi:MAG TPA: GNAT family N-acetyltransferase [Candidatus Baltobacteraceae bacterium]|nr:GNAT family N-acetyltransferase [Candidatus Baltobacteraceae bacterium]
MIEIRQAGAGDLDELAPLYTAYRRHFNPEAKAEDSLPFLQQRFERDECVVFLAISDAEACGFILLYPLWSSWYCKRIWFLSDLYVAPEQRNGGAGRLLVERVKTFAAESGAKSVMVELPRSEPHLQTFYDRLGFARDPVFELARWSR